MKVSAQYAQENFSDILTAFDTGEEVEISLPGKPALVLLQRGTPTPFMRMTQRILGEGVREMIVPEWDEWKDIDRELEREAAEHPLVQGEL
jgi:antitoxin (DNA-binding transcriptional repressor) of toxin-antitoxin stability system